MTSGTPRLRLLIDGDIVIHRLASVLEEPIDWGDDIWGLYADFKQAKQQIKEDIETLIDHAKLGYLEFHKLSATTPLPDIPVSIALSDSNRNWRHTILSSYKKNRSGKRKPILWKPLREHLLNEYNAIMWPNLEADDVLGILSSNHAKSKPIIISEDKDFKTIPCFFYQPSKAQLSCISKTEADRHHLTQTLVGDSADGYKGCPGVGPVKAKRILKKGIWEEVVDAYEKTGSTEYDALVQARVSHILRFATEYSKPTGKVRLWNPIRCLGKRRGMSPNGPLYYEKEYA